jgi:hypothetical protein
MTQSDLPEETEKNMKPDYLKAPVIGMRPQGMNRSTFGTAISPKAHGFRTLIEIPSHIPMPPEPPALAPGTTRRTRPWIFLSDLLQKLDIELTVQYQEISLAGITEGSIPAREAPSVIPFLSLIVFRISNAIFKVKRGEIQTARDIHAKETEKQPGDRFHLPRHPSTRPAYPDGHWPRFA